MTTATKTNSAPSYEDVANFNLGVDSRARNLQIMCSGLLSNSGALKIATFEQFNKGVVSINNAVSHVRLLDGETKEEKIQAMMQYAHSASSFNSREASLIVENMLDKFSTEYQVARNSNKRNSSSSSNSSQTHIAREESQALRPLMPLQPLQFQKDDWRIYTYEWQEVVGTEHQQKEKDREEKKKGRMNNRK